jgi:N-acetylglutamate synthase-like GNAT family acetyltransferase
LDSKATCYSNRGDVGLYIAAPRRKQGIGATLVSAIEKKAHELGVQTLYLYTPESETFYARLGWHVNERTEYHGCPVSIMEKQIVL